MVKKKKNMVRIEMDYKTIIDLGSLPTFAENTRTVQIGAKRIVVGFACENEEEYYSNFVEPLISELEKIAENFVIFYTVRKQQYCHIKYESKFYDGELKGDIWDFYIHELYLNEPRFSIAITNSTTKRKLNWLLSTK